MKLNILILACLLMALVQSCTVAVEKTLFENNYTGVTFDTPSDLFEEITWSDPQTIEDYSQFTFQTLFNFNMFSPKFYDLNLVSEPLKSGLIATIKNRNKTAARIQYIAKSSDEEKDFLLFQFYAYNQSDNPIKTQRFYSNLIQPYKDTLMIVSYSNDQDLANGKFSVFLKGHDGEGAIAYDQAIWEVKQVNFSDSLNIRIGREIVQDGIMGFNVDKQGNEVSATEQSTETKIIKDQEISYVIKLVYFREAYLVTIKKSFFEVKNDQGDYEVVAEDFVTNTIVPDVVDIYPNNNGWIKLFYTPTTDYHYNKDVRFVITTHLVNPPSSRRIMEINIHSLVVSVIVGVVAFVVHKKLKN